MYIIHIYVYYTYICILYIYIYIDMYVLYINIYIYIIHIHIHIPIYITHKPYPKKMRWSATKMVTRGNTTIHETAQGLIHPVLQ